MFSEGNKYDLPFQVLIQNGHIDAIFERAFTSADNKIRSLLWLIKNPPGIFIYQST